MRYIRRDDQKVEYSDLIGGGEGMSFKIFLY